jgi:pyruvate,water dikinase
MARGKELIRGKPGAPGEVVVTVRVVAKSPGQMALVKPGEVMVAERTEPPDEPYMAKASAIITDLGGMTSHAAMTAKKLKIPCVVGTLEATDVLKDGQKVVVDGTNGVVYEYVEGVPSATGSLADKMAALAAQKGIKLNPDFLKKIQQK